MANELNDPHHAGRYIVGWSTLTGPRGGRPVARVTIIPNDRDEGLGVYVGPSVTSTRALAPMIKAVSDALLYAQNQLSPLGE